MGHWPRLNQTKHLPEIAVFTKNFASNFVLLYDFKHPFAQHQPSPRRWSNNSFTMEVYPYLETWPPQNTMRCSCFSWKKPRVTFGATDWQSIKLEVNMIIWLGMGSTNIFWHTSSWIEVHRLQIYGRQCRNKLFFIWHQWFTTKTKSTGSQRVASYRNSQNQPKTHLAFSYLKRGRLLINCFFFIVFLFFPFPIFSHLKNQSQYKWPWKSLSFVIDSKATSFLFISGAFMESDRPGNKTLQVPKPRNSMACCMNFCSCDFFSFRAPRFWQQQKTPLFGGLRTKKGEDMGIYSGTQKPTWFFRRQKLIWFPKRW